MDEWGGVSVDNTDDFGGIAVEDEPSTPPPPRFNDELIAALPERERRKLEDYSGGPELPDTKPLVEIPNTTYRSRTASLEDTRPAFDLEEQLVAPEAIRMATELGGVGRVIESLPEKPRELAEGFREGVEAQLGGLTSPMSIAMTPAFAIPYVGPALAMGMGAKAIGTGAGTATSALEGGNLREVGVGLSEIAGGAAMVAAPLLHKAAPEIPREVLVKIDQAKQTGLTKAAAAAEEAVVRKVIEPDEVLAPSKEWTVSEHVPASEFQLRNMTPDQLMAHFDDAVTAPLEQAAIAREMQLRLSEQRRGLASNSGIEEGARVDIREQVTEAPVIPKLVPVVKTEGGRMFAGERHTHATSSALEAMREGKISADDLSTMQQGFYDLQSKKFLTREGAAKARKSGTAELTSEQIPEAELKANTAEFVEQQQASGREVINRINQLPVEEAVKLNQRPEMYRDLDLKPEDAPALQKASDNAFSRFEAFLESGNEAAAQAEMGKGVFFNGAIEWANKKGPNYERGIAETAPTPELAAEGVGAIPENVPTARPAIAQEGTGRGSSVAEPITTEVSKPAPNATSKPGSITEPQRAAAFFERESEAQGLGRSSLPPTVEDVRAQQARDAGAPPPVGPPKPGAAASPAPEPRGTLDDVYGIFETDPKPSPTIKQRVIKASEAFRTGLSSSFRPLNKLVEDVAKQYGLPLKKADLAGLFEQLKGSSGKAEADIYRFDQDVSKAVKGSEKDFNAYLFLRRSLDRLGQDIARGETRRAVSGYTIPELQSKLATLEAKLTPEQRTSFQMASENFQRHMDEALKLQVDSGRMSPEVYQAIKDGNQFYAPFKVMKYLEETSRPAGTGRRVDTPASFVKAMEGIESADFKLGDMLAAARQNISLSRVLAEKNKAMQNITDLAALDTEGLFLKKLKLGQEAPQGMEAVNVFEAGKQQRYAVNSAVAEAINAMGPKSSNILLRMAGGLFRAGVTTYNIPFQISNLLADTPRAALMSRYGVNILPELVMYPFDAIYAKAKGIPVSQVNKRLAASAMQSLRFPLSLAEAVYSSITGDVLGAKNKLMLDFLDSGTAGTTMQEYLTPGALRPKEGPLKSVKNVLKTPLELAKAIEQINKITGIRQAMKVHGVDSGKLLPSEAITELRRFSGSPDFGRVGKWTEAYGLNAIQVFFNARVQGLIADAGRLAGRDGARASTAAWINLMAYVGIPSLYLYLNNQRDEEAATNYSKRPEQEKRNYWLVPKQNEDGTQKYITGAGGEKIPDYWRVPKRESAKWMANFTEAAMDFAKEKDPEAFRDWSVGMLEDMSPLNVQGDTMQERLESVASGLNPILKAPMETATGRDLYRHKDIIPEVMKKASPEQQYTDRTGEVFKQLAEAMPDVAPEVFRSPLMLENLTKNITGGLITQFMPRKPIEGREGIENNPLLQRFQSVPYTDSSEFEDRMDKLERETADEQLTRFRNADKLLKENKSQDLKALVQKSMTLYGPDRKQVEKLVDLWTAEQRGITPQERRIMALPVAQRAEYIIGELSGKTPEQRAAIIRSYATKRILTEGVAEQMLAQGFK